MSVSIPQSKKFDPYRPENLKNLDDWPKLANSMRGSKKQFWNDDDLFQEILKKHGGIKATDEQKRAIAAVMSIIYYGEIVAMHTSSHLVGMMPDLTAQFVAAFQCMEEAKHVTAMGQYLNALDIEIPEINPHIKKLLEDVRKTRDPVEKLMGMNLLVELGAHSLFQMLINNFDEPVLQELLHYIDLDEVKHVALARNYLSKLMEESGRLSRTRAMLKQVYWMSLLVRAQNELFRQFKALRVDMHAQIQRNMADMRKVYKEVPRDVQRTWLLKPLSRKQAENVANWAFPPKGTARYEKLKVRSQRRRAAKRRFPLAARFVPGVVYDYVPLGA